MQSNHLSTLGLKIRELVYIRHVGSGHSTWSPPKSVVWSDVALRRSLEHRLGHKTFTDKYHSD